MCMFRRAAQELTLRKYGLRVKENVTSAIIIQGFRKEPSVILCVLLKRGVLKLSKSGKNILGKFDIIAESNEKMHINVP
jgi:hypothetical protein